jgi:TIR domain
MYLYVDDYLSPETRGQLFQDAEQLDIDLKVVDRRHADYMTEHETPQAFICHDSRDKDDVARPLAYELARLGCPVWFDEFSLRVGQSLRESIDKGIAISKKCIVVLSPNFMSNSGWSKREFNGVMGKHIGSDGGVLLPIWYKVTWSEVFDYSPMVADIRALSTSSFTIEQIGAQMYREIMLPSPAL